MTVLGNLTAGRIRAVTGDIGAIDVGGQAGGAGRGNLQAQVQADAGDILEIKVNGDFKLPAGMTTDAQLVSAPKGAVGNVVVNGQLGGMVNPIRGRPPLTLGWIYGKSVGYVRSVSGDILLSSVRAWDGDIRGVEAAKTEAAYIFAWGGRFRRCMPVRCSVTCNPRSRSWAASRRAVTSGWSRPSTSNPRASTPTTISTRSWRAASRD